MVERRKPLILTSTKLLIDSVLRSSSSFSSAAAAAAAGGSKQETEERTTYDGGGSKGKKFGDGGDELLLPSLQLQAGILRFPKDKTLISDSTASSLSLDDSALVGLSISVLKTLSITSGSLVHTLLGFIFFFLFFVWLLRKFEGNVLESVNWLQLVLA